MTSDDDNRPAWREWYDRKSAHLETIPGTAIATKELCESPDDGSSNDVFDAYELVMFTRHSLNMKQAQNPKTAFGQAHASINAILNSIAAYSTQATLNPNETCEFPADFEGIGGKCLIFDGYACHTDEEGKTFGLLALIEVFRSEMEFARTNGGAELIQRLKDNGHYPYSDLDREPVA